jgi:hypothetical protein
MANDDDVIAKELSGFNIVKKTKRAAPFLPPDSTTPDIRKLHDKYGSDSAEESVLERAQPPSSDEATHAVVVEPKNAGDGPAKQLTVLVKNGKIRAKQG